jgi:hypothetical protein
MKRLTCKIPENIFIFGFFDELAESGGYSVSSVDGFFRGIFRMKSRFVLLTAVTCSEGAETASIMTLGIMTLGVMTLGIMTLGIMTLGIMTLAL